MRFWFSRAPHASGLLEDDREHGARDDDGENVVVDALLIGHEDVADETEADPDEGCHDPARKPELVRIAELFALCGSVRADDGANARHPPGEEEDCERR